VRPRRDADPSPLSVIIIIIIIIIGTQPLGRSGQRSEFTQATGCGSGTLHPGQVLRGSLPLLSPAPSSTEVKNRVELYLYSP